MAKTTLGESQGQNMHGHPKHRAQAQTLRMFRTNLNKRALSPPRLASLRRIYGMVSYKALSHLARFMQPPCVLPLPNPKIVEPQPPEPHPPSALITNPWAP